MHKAQRLIQLIMLVNEKKKFTIGELAAELGVSRRTMIRDLMELCELGVPLYSEVGAAGGYRVLREKVLPPISFTEKEVFALFFASQSLKYYKSLPFAGEAASALQKFHHYLPGDIRNKIDAMKRRLTFWVPPHQLDVPFLQPLLEAALEQSAIVIVYDGQHGRQRRRLQPVGLYTMNGLWYLQAYCLEKRAERVFRVDRVLDMKVAEDQSDKLDLAEERVESRIMRFDEKDSLELEVRLTAEGVRRCRSDLWLSGGLQVEPDGTGKAVAEMGASFLPWAVGYFLSFGTDADVVRPTELRERIRQRIELLKSHYDK